MTPNDVYAMIPESISRDVSMLVGCYYNHIPEVCDFCGDLDWSRNERVEVKLVKHYNFDFRRFWRLGSVWFDGKPIMIFQNAGREGDDHKMRYITNTDGYLEMIEYLATLRKPSELNKSGKDTKWVNPDDDCGDLAAFYGDSIGTLERRWL